ncbi:hypothetical protein [Niallia oryzisoli]|uniref:hypothetical protein n=1 Tax=Niallia oryzisoli TaxID=1737571 RepID=UPI00373502DD
MALSAAGLLEGSVLNMLKNCNESDFIELKWIAYGRLEPMAISLWMLITTLAMAGIPLLMYQIASTDMFLQFHDGLNNLLPILRTSFWFQLLFSLLFLIPKVAYKFQRIQVFILNFWVLKVSVDFYAVIYLISVDRVLPETFTTTLVGIIVFGLLFTFISTIRGVKRAREGQFRKGGKLLYDFQNSKLYFRTSLVFGITMISGAIARHSTGVFSVLFFLILCIIIQLGIGLAYPEFFLLLYCKIRFTSFIIEPRASSKKKKQSIKQPLSLRSLWRKRSVKVWVISFAGSFILLTIYQVIGKLIGKQKYPFSELWAGISILSFGVSLLVLLIMFIVKKIRKQ